MIITNRQITNTKQAPNSDNRSTKWFGDWDVVIGDSGVTLIEILLASAIAVFVALGIGVMDVARLRMENELRSRGGVLSQQANVSLAVLSLSKTLERADRIIIRNGGAAGDIQLRTFEPDTDCPVVGAGCPVVCTGCTGAIRPSCCFDLPGNYQWDEYKRNAGTNEIWCYRNVGAGCARRVLAGEATQFNVAFSPEAAAPPGGDPPVGVAGEDNNTVAFMIRWDTGTDAENFPGKVTSRVIQYSNVNAGAGDSGWGQATGAADPSAPPAVCP